MWGGRWTIFLDISLLLFKLYRQAGLNILVVESTELVFLNIYGAQEPIPRNEFPPAYVAWRAGTIILFLLSA
jgi:hypothetical protein